MASGDDKRTKDAWDKLSIAAGFLASVAVPVVIALVGNWYTTAIKERETAISERDQDREWVQLGLSILRDPNTKQNLRTWGVKIVSNFGKIPMEDETKKALEEGAVLPEAAAAQVVSNVQSAVLPTATSRTKAIGDLQTQGVQALLAKDLPAAISAYDQAYQIWPTFRQVDEIRRALMQADKPGGSERQQLYKTIARMDLRGVSDDLQEQLKKAAESS